MAASYSRDHLRFLYNRLKDKLWVKPLWMCFCSICAVFIAKLADHYNAGLFVPPISLDSIVALLEIYVIEHVGDRHLFCWLDDSRLHFC